MDRESQLLDYEYNLFTDFDELFCDHEDVAKCSAKDDSDIILFDENLFSDASYDTQPHGSPSDSEQPIESDDLIDLEELVFNLPLVSAPASYLLEEEASQARSLVSLSTSNSSSQIPEFDQLRNLPEEIVDRPREWVRNHLQAMLDEVTLQLETDIPVSIALRSRDNPTWTPRHFLPGSRAHHFRCLIRVIEIVIETLANNIIITKRDVYYRDPTLFASQKTVDRIIEMLAWTLLIPRNCLHVVASAKGMLAGHITFQMKDSTSTISSSTSSTDILIPPLTSIQQTHISAKYILIIEKEAIFRTLSSSKFYSHPLLPPGLLLTAKGFPDLATREFLALVQTPYDYRHNLEERIPMFCLVDGDPYGVSIFGVYKYGSDKCAVIERERLALPSLQFLGISHVDFQMGIGEDENVIALTERDQRKIDIMMEKELVKNEPEILYILFCLRSDCRDQLRWMKRWNGKREIEAVCETWEGGLIGYLIWKLRQALDMDEITLDNMELHGVGEGEEDIEDIGMMNLESEFEDFMDADMEFDNLNSILDIFG